MVTSLSGMVSPKTGSFPTLWPPQFVPFAQLAAILIFFLPSFRGESSLSGNYLSFSWSSVPGSGCTTKCSVDIAAGPDYPSRLSSGFTPEIPYKILLPTKKKVKLAVCSVLASLLTVRLLFALCVPAAQLSVCACGTQNTHTTKTPPRSQQPAHTLRTAIDSPSRKNTRPKFSTHFFRHENRTHGNFTPNSHEQHTLRFFSSCLYEKSPAKTGAKSVHDSSAITTTADCGFFFRIAMRVE